MANAVRTPELKYNRMLQYQITGWWACPMVKLFAFLQSNVRKVVSILRRYFNFMVSEVLTALLVA
jgi:hypothetical protein